MDPGHKLRNEIAESAQISTFNDVECPIEHIHRSSNTIDLDDTFCDLFIAALGTSLMLVIIVNNNRNGNFMKGKYIL